MAAVAAVREVKLESIWESKIRLKPDLTQKIEKDLGGPGRAPAGARNPTHQDQRAGRAQAGPQGLLLTRNRVPLAAHCHIPEQLQPRVLIPITRSTSRASALD